LSVQGWLPWLIAKAGYKVLLLEAGGDPLQTDDGKPMEHTSRFLLSILAQPEMIYGGVSLSNTMPTKNNNAAMA